MKNIQKIRLVVQIICTLLTVIGFFTSFSIVSGFIFVSGVLGGAFFCGWICPFGSLQEFFSRIGDLIGVKKIKMPKIIQKIMVFSRYIVFAVAMLITTDLIFQLLSFDPRSNFLSILLSKNINMLAVLIIVGFAFLSILFERPFCNYLCIEGAKRGFLSTFRPFTISRDSKKCVNCKKCTKVCQMNIDVAKCDQMHSPQCINCMKCISACPIDDTLKYGKRRFDHKEKKKYLMLIVILFLSLTVGLVSGLINVPSHHDGESQGTIDASVGQTVEAPTVGSKLDAYEDGVYTGQGNGFKGEITVQIVIENSFITSVEVTEHRDDDKWFNRAYKSIVNKIVNNQSTDVDVVGGATYSSQGIIDGVKAALKKAEV